MGLQTRQVHLVRRPEGTAQPTDFGVAGATLADLADGQVLVENLWMSVDPYMRRSMSPDATDLERAFNTGREGYYGWMGFGGSIFQWHPEQEIGFAFVPTALHVLDLLNERGKVYQAEVVRCVLRLKK